MNFKGKVVFSIFGEVSRARMVRLIKWLGLKELQPYRQTWDRKTLTIYARL
jgi:hypothetical protein